MMPGLTGRTLMYSVTPESIGRDIDVMSNIGVNWTSINDMSDAGINWSDVDVMSDAGNQLGGLGCVK